MDGIDPRALLRAIACGLGATVAAVFVLAGALAAMGLAVLVTSGGLLRAVATKLRVPVRLALPARLERRRAPGVSTSSSTA
jgi:hypothetical protein